MVFFMKSRKPAISVLIPTFNRAQYLGECLESLLSQTLPPAQIILVNDGSTDQTIQRLKPFRNKIIYLEADQVGKPSAINLGLAKVSGDYVWIFDDDDVALPDALQRFVEPLEKHPEHGFSFSSYYYSVESQGNKRIARIQGQSPIPDFETRGFLIPLMEWNFLGGAALFARTAVYDHVGEFTQDLLRSQDYEMAIRIALHFTGIRVKGEATFHYRQHAGVRGNLRDRFAAREKNKYWLKYDQVFFRRLYNTLPLEKYLPPGDDIASKYRQALLQRMAIMASKLLHDEIINDLRQLAEVQDHTPFSKQERAIILFMMSTPWYGMDNITSNDEFFNQLRKISNSAKIIAMLYSEILHNLRHKALTVNL